MNRRLAALGAGLLGLAALVALATRAKTPTGGRGATHAIDGQTIVGYTALAIMGLAVVGVPVLAYAFWTERSTGREWLPPRKNWLVRFLLSFTLLAVILGLLLRTDVFRDHRAHGKSPPAGSVPADSPTSTSGHGRSLAFDWVPVLVVGGLTLVGTGAALLLLRRRLADEVATPGEIADAVAASLDASIDELATEGDPRRAVIAAYARMGRTLAAHGLPRALSGAPNEYLRRVLTHELGAGGGAATRLTALFERAKFSEHEIDGAMRSDAIDALAALRDELRSAR